VTYRRQFSWFTLIGALQYALDALLLFLLMASGMSIVNANLVSRTLVGLGGFLANRYITFRETRVHFWPSLLRFLLAWALMSMLSTIGILLAINVFLQEEPTPASGLIIKVLVEMAVFLCAFLLQKFYIFGSPAKGSKQP
jgi:putative flippase GtrA